MMNSKKKIKILLAINETSGAKIAHVTGVTRSAVYHTISGKSKSPRLRKAIADALNLPIEELWAED